jgi:hypothetical protein
MRTEAGGREGTASGRRGPRDVVPTLAAAVRAEVARVFLEVLARYPGTRWAVSVEPQRRQKTLRVLTSAGRDLDPLARQEM